MGTLAPWGGTTTKGPGEEGEGTGSSSSWDMLFSQRGFTKFCKKYKTKITYCAGN